jgi:hypothetical protein
MVKGLLDGVATTSYSEEEEEAASTLAPQPLSHQLACLPSHQHPLLCNLHAPKDKPKQKELDFITSLEPRLVHQ